MALSDPRFDNHLRSDFLIPFCLLNPSLSWSAQSRRFSHPVIRSSEAIKPFLDAVEGDDGLKESVKSLRVESSVGFVMGDESNALLLGTVLCVRGGRGLAERIVERRFRNISSSEESVIFCSPNEFPS